MSDGFIAVLGMGFLAGAITTLIIMGVCSNERADDIDLDMWTYIPNRNRGRSGNKRSDEQVER